MWHLGLLKYPKTRGNKNKQWTHLGGLNTNFFYTWSLYTSITIILN